MIYRTHIDSFTTLDGLTRKQQDDPKLVLAAIMKSGGMFSVFDATATPTIAHTMEFIMRRSGWVMRIADQCAYPWTVVALTEEGAAVIAEMVPTQIFNKEGTQHVENEEV